MLAFFMRPLFCCCCRLVKVYMGSTACMSKLMDLCRDFQVSPVLIAACALACSSRRGSMSQCHLPDFPLF